MSSIGRLAVGCVQLGFAAVGVGVLAVPLFLTATWLWLVPVGAALWAVGLLLMVFHRPDGS